MFGITSTANARYLPYAAKFNLKLLIPAACRTSGYYKGRLPLSTFNGNDAILSVYNSVKLANLISLADSLNDLDDINFSCAINMDLSLSTGMTPSDTTSPNSYTLTREYFEYIIIPGPAISIAATSTMTNILYSVLIEAHYHVIMNISARDPLLYRLLTPKNIYYAKAIMQGVPLLSIKGFKPPRNKSELTNMLKHVTYFESNTSFENNMSSEKPIIKSVDSELDEIHTVESEDEKGIVHIFSNEALASIVESTVADFMAKYNISPEPALKAVIPGPNLKDITFKVMLDQDGNLAAAYDKNVRHKKAEKFKKIKEIAEKAGMENIEEAKETYKKQKAEEVKMLKEKAVTLDSYIKTKGITYNGDLTFKANIALATKALEGEEAFGLSGESLARKVMDRLKRNYQIALKKQSKGKKEKNQIEGQ